MADQKSLITKRGQIKGQLTRFASYMNQIKTKEINNEVIIELKNRLSKIESNLDEFNDVQYQLELLDKDTSKENEHFTERDNFETDFFSLTASAESLIKDHTKSISNPVENENINAQNLVGVKLPTIQLPTFTGQYDKWLEFYDTFNSLIHTNDKISNIQKYHYLRSSLKNEAATVIQSLEVSEINYPKAWKILRERFENKKLIIHNHVSSIFNLRPIEKESHTSLRATIDQVQNHLRSLESLQLPINSWDALLIYLVSSKLDQNSRREWEFYKTKSDIPTFTEFIQFLRERCDILETVNTVTHSNSHRSNTYHKQTNNKSLTKNYLVTNAFSCVMCKDHHAIYDCNEFLKLPIDKRISQVRALNLCSNCLRKGHFIKNCKSQFVCKKCNKKHNTLLHLDTPDIKSMSEQPSSSGVSNHATSNQINQILLSTACVKVYDNNGKDYNCRVLLDSGSQSNFITEKMCKLLHLQEQAINTSITGINQSLLTIKSSVHVRISSLCNTFNTDVSCLVLPKITDQLPSISFNPSVLKIPQNIRLADPEFYKPQTIDMLVGSQLFWHLLSVGQIDLGKNLPILQKTKLGWIISGPVCISPNAPLKTLCSLESLESQIKRFWQIEEFSNPQISPTDQYCEELFIKTSKRNAEGRFIVQIPFLRAISTLGESKQTAIKRQLTLERKFAKQPHLHNDYVKFMEEYESLGHMSLVSQSDDISKTCFYLPHHAVTREDSITTKIRVVFDGSAKSSSGVSLNDIQAVGPPLQQDLISILLRFRSYSYVASADITKMYRQILIDPSQRDLQRILWRKTANEPLQAYTLNTVTYGTTSAPFLAMRCIRQLALDNNSKHKQACNAILNDFYVDDLLTGTNSRDELIKVCTDINNILIQAGFELRKWTSNDSNMLQQISLSNNSSNEHFVKLGENSKILGIHWIPTSDTLQYNINPRQVNKVTKRNILSTVAQIYDPLGLLSPVIIIAKIIIQNLWHIKLHWDESIPLNLYTRWKEFIHQLPILNSLHITRYIMCNEPVETELHGFCDASTLAYGACVFVRSVNSQKETIIIKRIQQQCFSREYSKLQQSKLIDSNSQLLSLHPFLDQYGIIRVGGRLKNSPLNYQRKHPIILPRNHHITNIISRDEHLRILHSGPQALLASLRERYWPLAGRNLVRKIVRECVSCFRAKPVIHNQLMGNLPATRVTPNRPFLISGVDYAGPFLIKDRKTRGAKLIKSYVCLFVCFSIKAIHLELVCDLTTQSFLNALHRFQGRRGNCSDIYSDNATNFVGANNELTELADFLKKQGSNISNILARQRLTWHFIPPRSPHFGGLWEAGVRSTKYHIKRVLNNTKLTYEEFNTALVQIEACLNSRPLTPLSSDPNDLNPLTPAHFLIGESLVSHPESTTPNVTTSRHIMFQHTQQLQQHFWERWSKEYVSELQQRVRWKTTALSHLKRGTMVIVKEDHLAPQQWRLGRITELHPGQDNLVRVVSIKTATGEIKRSISRICVLPIESQGSQDGGHV